MGGKTSALVKNRYPNKDREPNRNERSPPARGIQTASRSKIYKIIRVHTTQVIKRDRMARSKTELTSLVATPRVHLLSKPVSSGRPSRMVRPLKLEELLKKS
jgi:hypothetical protein